MTEIHERLRGFWDADSSDRRSPLGSRLSKGTRSPPGGASVVVVWTRWSDDRDPRTAAGVLGRGLLRSEESPRLAPVERDSKPAGGSERGRSLDPVER